MRIKANIAQIALAAWVALCLAVGLSGSADAQTIEAKFWKTFHQKGVVSVAFSPDSTLLASDGHLYQTWRVMAICIKDAE